LTAASGISTEPATRRWRLNFSDIQEIRDGQMKFIRMKSMKWVAILGVLLTMVVTVDAEEPPYRPQPLPPSGPPQTRSHHSSGSTSSHESDRRSSKRYRTRYPRYSRKQYRQYQKRYRQYQKRYRTYQKRYRKYQRHYYRSGR
jgi:hypothetical protein